MTQNSSLVGKILANKYKLIRPITAGGMGQVFLAEHMVARGEQRAIKIIHPELIENQQLRKRFLREVEVTRKVSKANDHVVFVYDDYGFEGKIGYYVMEFLEGKTLTQCLEASPGGLPVAWSLHVVTQICSAMSAAHELGVIHRDLKPDNIFLINYRGTPDFVKVVDFGIARDENASTHLTTAGQTGGTILYMSPEQIRGPASIQAGDDTPYIDGRADIYSLGCVLFELLTGRTPFIPRGKGPLAISQILQDHLQTPLPPCQVIRPEIPDELVPVLEMALAKDPDLRFSSMASFSDALRSLSCYDFRMGQEEGPFLQTLPMGAHTPTGHSSGATETMFPFQQYEDDEEAMGQTVASISATAPMDLVEEGSETVLEAHRPFQPSTPSQKPHKTLPLGDELEAGGSRSSLPIASVVVLVLLCLAGLGWYMARPSTKPKTPRTATPSPKAKVELLVSTGNVTAEVWRGGKRIGFTPFPLKGKVGQSYSLELRAKGYKTLLVVGALSPDAQLLKLNLKPEQPRTPNQKP